MDYLKRLNEVIVGLSEIDQDCAVLDTIFREPQQKKIIGRIDETIGFLMKMKEDVKAANVKQYELSKFKSLNQNKNSET